MMRDGSPKFRLVLALVVLGAFSALAAVYGGNLGVRAAVGSSAPDFRLPLLDGEELTLADLAGRPVVLNFWTTWCPPCREEVPDLQAVWQEYDGAFHLIGINVEEPPSVILPFAAELEMRYPVALDRNRRLAGRYGIRGLPETFFIDGAGVIRHIHRGPLDADGFRTLLALHLALAAAD